MRGVLIGFTVVALAFAIGTSGAPGLAFAAATDWLEGNGSLVLEGPVGEAVRDAL